MNLIKKVLGLITLLMMISSVSFAEEWTYLGRFMLRNNVDHTTDVLILDHLMPYKGMPNGFKLFDVYYYHDHSSDYYKNDGIVSITRINVQGKIVPLNQNGEKMNYSGISFGTIVSDIEITNKGVFGVVPKSFRIFDSASHELIFSSQGQMRSDMLYRGSAAEYIVNVTAPHPGISGIITGQ